MLLLAVVTVTRTDYNKYYQYELQYSS